MCKCYTRKVYLPFQSDIYSKLFAICEREECQKREKYDLLPSASFVSPISGLISEEKMGGHCYQGKRTYWGRGGEGSLVNTILVHLCFGPLPNFDRK